MPGRVAREALASDLGRGPASGQIAQLVEHTTENRGVPSSNLGLAIEKALQMGMF